MARVHRRLPGGITLTSIGIGFLGEPALAKLLEPVFGGLSHAVAVTISVTFAFAPRHLDPHHVRRADPEAARDSAGRDGRRGDCRGRSAPSGSISAPFALGLTKVANAIVRLFGVARRPWMSRHSSEDLKIIIAQSQTGGSLDPGEAGMLGGVFHLHEQEAREVMTPIPAVITVNASETVEEALQRCVSSGHTRLIVIEDDNPDRSAASSTTTASPAST